MLNAEFLRLDANYEDFLPDLRSSETLLLGSDYSGESSNAPYLVLSFLITSLESWSKWEPQRLKVRLDYLPDSRRMSFKRLGDIHRRKALAPLLYAANRLNGLSLSVALNKKCDSVFEANPPLDLSNPEFAAYRKWKPEVLEKAFLAIHIVSILLAGLAAPGQNMIWLTDEGDIAANNDRVCELTRLFSWISSIYLTFNLGHCRCGTSKCDDGTRQIEDILAIPDLIAGAISEQLITRETQNLPNDVFLVHHGSFSNKTKDIIWWFSESSKPLKRLVCVVDPSTDRKKHLLSWFHFYNQK